MDGLMIIGLRWLAWAHSRLASVFSKIDRETNIEYPADQ